MDFNQENLKHLTKATKNIYSDAKKVGIETDIIKQSMRNYFRMLLISNDGLSLQKFKLWAEKNGNFDFYKFALDDLSYLEKEGFIIQKANSLYSFLDNARLKLFEYQKKFFDINKKRVEILSTVTDNEFTEPFFLSQQQKFNDLIASDEEIKKYLLHVATLHNTSFSNSVLTYLHSKENSFNYIQSFSSWKELLPDFKLVEGASPFEILVPIVENGYPVAYSKKMYYDVSDVVGFEQFNLTKEYNVDDLLSDLKNSIRSSSVIGEVITISSLKGSSTEQIEQISNQLAQYYFFDNDEENMFEYLFNNAFGIKSEFSNLEPDFQEFTADRRNKLLNVVNIMNFLSNELLLDNIIYSSRFKNSLYINLGIKDAKLLSDKAIIEHKNLLSGTNKNEYIKGVEYIQADISNASSITRDILSNEDITIVANYENLFAMTKKLTIESGDFKGTSFVLDYEISDDEMKDIVAKDFLLKAVEEEIRTNGLLIKNIQEHDDVVRTNEKLYSGEYQNDNGRLSQGDSFEDVSSNGNRGNATEDDDRKSGDGVELDERDDESRNAGARSLGDSEQEVHLHLESPLVSSEYELFFKNAKYDKFEHTKTKEILDIMILDKKLSKADFKDFIKYLKDNNFGYYSRIAKGFIITDQAILNHFVNSQVSILDTVDDRTYNVISSIKVLWSDLDSTENIIYDDFYSLNKYYEEVLNRKSISPVATKLEVIFDNKGDKFTVTPNIKVGEQDFNPKETSIENYLNIKYKNGILDNNRTINVEFADATIKQKVDPRLIKNAEFIKQKTGLDYSISHFQSAEFTINSIEYSIDESGKASRYFLPLGNKEGWSIKERWIGYTNSRKHTIENLLEEKTKALEVVENYEMSMDDIKNILEIFTIMRGNEKADSKNRTTNYLKGIVYQGLYDSHVDYIGNVPFSREDSDSIIDSFEKIEHDIMSKDLNDLTKKDLANFSRFIINEEYHTNIAFEDYLFDKIKEYRKENNYFKIVTKVLQEAGVDVEALTYEDDENDIYVKFATSGRDICYIPKNDISKAGLFLDSVYQFFEIDAPQLIIKERDDYKSANKSENIGFIDKNESEVIERESGNFTEFSDIENSEVEVTEYISKSNNDEDELSSVTRGDENTKEVVPLQDKLNMVESFISKAQYEILSTSDELSDKIDDIYDVVSSMPKSYETDGLGDKAIAHLHYFINGSDWYITEKDMEVEQLQAFGYVVLNGDLQNAELGYINIEELKKVNVEMDFYWNKKSLETIKKEHFGLNNVEIASSDDLVNLFGINKEKLEDILSNAVTKGNINDYGKFDALKDSADKEKIVSYFEALEGISLPIFKSQMRFHNLLRDYIIENSQNNNIEVVEVLSNTNIITLKEMLSLATSKLDVAFEYEFSNDEKELTILNLKDFYTTSEIEDIFINKQVLWEIFSDKYIFDLTNNEHVQLLEKELIKSLDANDNKVSNFNKAQIKRAIKEYPNAGLDINDSVAVAQGKINQAVLEIKEEPTPKELQSNLVNQFIDDLDNKLVVESSLELIKEAKDSGSLSIQQIGSEKVSIKNYKTKKSLEFSTKELLGKDQVTTILNELVFDNQFYQYGMKARPFGLGTYPENKNYLHVDDAKTINNVEYFNILNYSKPLTSEEISKFELVDLQNKEINYSSFVDMLEMASTKKEIKSIFKKITDSYQNGSSLSTTEFEDLKEDAIEYLKEASDDSFSFDIEQLKNEVTKIADKTVNENTFLPASVNSELMKTLTSISDDTAQYIELLKVYNKQLDQGREALSDSILSSSSRKDTEEEDNFTIEGEIAEGGAKTKFKNNIAAIEVINKLDNDITISKEERVVLSKYVGWGGIPQAFPKASGTVSKNWESEVEELKSVLNEEQYEQARRSVLDSYYTSEIITKAMWNGVDRLGFKGGSVLEPSVGAGNFFGYMPTKLKPNSQLLGVELDETTSKIAKELYPKAKIYNMGFEKFELNNNAVSLAIGNPPFGQHKIYDEKNKALSGSSIHNYFMGKTIDKVEEGGLMAMVVSNSFLDSQDISTRAYIGKSANLISAIRLPNNAFSKNANTEVTTDIIFLQKRTPNEPSNIDEWLHTDELNETPINGYFKKYPHKLLGEWGKFGTMYQGGTPALVAKKGQDTKDLLAKAISELPVGIMKNDSVYNQLAKSLQLENGNTVTTDARPNSYFIHDDAIYFRMPDYNGEMVVDEITTRVNSVGNHIELKEKEIERIKGMIEISNIANKIKHAQLDDSLAYSLSSMRNDLNASYDSFKKQFGFLNNNVNKRLFEDDVNAPFLLALETKYDKGISRAVANKAGVDFVKENAEKSDIFFKRTQYPYKAPNSAKNYKDALSISLSEKAFVDIEYMASLLNKNIEDVENHLSDMNLIFDDPNYGWVTKEEYLSGNVKEKYRETTISKNLKALKEVIPLDIEAIDISVSCGAGWIPSSDIESFAKEILNVDEISATYASFNATWNLSRVVVGSDIESTHGTPRRKVKDILLAALNNKQMTVYDTVGEGAEARKVVNSAETAAANDKIDSIKEIWNDWIWSSADRRERLARLYNDKFNVYAKREFDGSHLTFPGKVNNNVIDLRPHQKNAVWRSLQNGRELFDHDVGSGKTFSAVASVMELRRTNRAKKPLVVVPNHLVSDWGKAFVQLYPSANVLVPTKKDFTAKRRKLLMSRIATGDYDAIIIAHSQLIKIENDPAFEQKFLKSQIRAIQQGIDAFRRDNGQGDRSLKQWESMQANLRAKIEHLNTIDRDENINFSELGIDAMVVDEAHEFKNLQFHTALQRIKGLGNPLGSKKAFDLYMKTQSLLEKTNNKNLIFLTGTPISNTIAEMFTVKRYLMSDELTRDGLEHFDAWVKQYAEITTDWELSASGKYKLSTRLSKFKNMPELLGAYSSFADVVTTQMIKEQLAKEGKTLDLPIVKGGRPQNIIVDRSEEQAKYIGVEDENGIYAKGSLVFRSENLPKGKPQKGDDNMLVVMNDARKASLDMRLIDPLYPDFKDSKVNKAIADVYELYLSTTDFKGTQLIFCDLSTPKGAVAKEKLRIQELIEKAESGDDKASAELDKISVDDLDALNNSFSVYDDIKLKLLNLGIPEREIAFIHDANTDKQKEDLFAKVNGGSVRVLLGSTSKMGAGMNVQKRIVGISNLDVPWRPSDMTQREGRGIRQGNMINAFYKLLKDNNYDLNILTKNSEFNDIVKFLNIKEKLNKLTEDARIADKFFEISVKRYATKNTLDSGLWEKIEAKATFIEQIRNGNITDREVEDIAGEALNAAEMKAAASGNPLIVEEMKLKHDIKKIESIKKSFNRTLYDRETRIKQYEMSIEGFSEKEAYYKEDINRLNEYKKEREEKKSNYEIQKAYNKKNGIKTPLNKVSDFSIEINGKIYTSREEAGAYIVKSGRELLHKLVQKDSIEIGSYAGFKISIEKNNKFSETEMRLNIIGSQNYHLVFDVREQKASGVAQQMINEINRIEKYYDISLDNHNRITGELPRLKELPTVFSKENELVSLKQRYKVVINKLKEAADTKVETPVSIEEAKTLTSSIENNWVDSNKDVDTDSLLSSGRSLNLSVLEKVDAELVGKCLVINNQLDRKDYLDFQKIFERFGGVWDKKLGAVIFSKDGLERIKDLLNIEDKDVDSSLSSIAGENQDNNSSEYISSNFNSSKVIACDIH